MAREADKTEKRTPPPLVPRDFLLGPVFAASRQSGPRRVVVGQKEYTIGGFHPLRAEVSPPALDIRHGRACFTILSFRDIFNDSPSFRFSLNEFCQRYAGSNGGRYSRDIKTILADLIDSFFQVKDLPTGRFHVYRILEHIDIEGRPIRRRDAIMAKSGQMEMWFNGVTLSEEFFGILRNVAELQHLRLDALTAMRSNLAQAIYLYIPSRAHHHRRQSPFEITLTTLLGQVGTSVPQAKWERRRLLTQNKHSVLSQLDGKETLIGTFHVDLKETADKKDHKLLAWIAPNEVQEVTGDPDSKLIQALKENGQGWTASRVRSRLKSRKRLGRYQVEIVERSGADYEGNERFLDLALTLLGESRFNSAIAEAKSDELEGRRATKHPTARLIYRLMEAAQSTPPPRSS